MAAIDDLITHIEDEALRDRIRTELKRLTSEKKFGLVFEEHLPELMTIPSAPLLEGSTVARRGDPTTNTWRVLATENGQVDCLNLASGERKMLSPDELAVVRQFGDPIFPSLVPVDRVENGSELAPWHILIEADNYHALQLLEYLYFGQVDCIYIDPPYNTGARDWKYNNDYVDSNDRWRHSKWLAFMQRRLRLAKRLLNPDTGVLIVTIDEHEVHHLGSLLSKLFPEARRQMITIVNNAAGVSQGGFYRVEEYAIFCFLGDARPVPIADDLLSDTENGMVPALWFSLIRYGGIDAPPSKRPGLVYPIGIDPGSLRIVGAGPTLRERVEDGSVTGDLDDWIPDPEETLDGTPVIWPYRKSGSLSRWQLKPETLLSLANDGFVRIREQADGPGGNLWSVSYIKGGNRKKVKQGEIPVLGREDGDGPLVLGMPTRRVIPKTVWRRAKHDAGKWGSRTIREILGNVSFDYAKSPYAVRDALASIVGEKKDALILDFFAGSGTTLHAIELLNAADGGTRRCILVTNNEVSESDAKALQKQGFRPRDDEWEALGVCRSVTWPRCKYMINGKRDDDTPIDGVQLTGITLDKEKPRRFRQIGFIKPDDIGTTAQRKQLVALIEGIPQSLIKKDTAFVVSDSHQASILFNDQDVEQWLNALNGKDHVTDFYIVTSNKQAFEDISAQVTDQLGPIVIREAEARPMSQGLSSNLEYFRLDFLEKDQVSIGNEFAQILPLLWLRAGAAGPRPELPNPGSAPSMLVPEENPFAVLIDETRFAEFRNVVNSRDDISHLFLITDSEDAFHEMASQLSAPHILQLYQDYLENFMLGDGSRA